MLSFPHSGMLESGGTVKAIADLSCGRVISRVSRHISSRSPTHTVCVGLCVGPKSPMVVSWGKLKKGAPLPMPLFPSSIRGVIR